MSLSVGTACDEGDSGSQDSQPASEAVDSSGAAAGVAVPESLGLAGRPAGPVTRGGDAAAGPMPEAAARPANASSPGPVPEAADRQAEGGANEGSAAGARSADAVPPEPELDRPEGWEEASHARGQTPDYERLFAEDRVHRIDVEMSAESQQTMYDDLDMLLDSGGGASFPGFPGRPRGNSGGAGATDLVGGDPVYVPVTVRYEGGVWTQVGMRYKGNSSLVSAWRSGTLKIGFRLDFDRYEEDFPETLDQRFYGFGKMTFASGYRDPSLIRDKLAAEILADQGMVAIRTAFYRVYVDAGDGPVYFGLYTMIEDPADQLIEAQFADKSGNLYKPSGPGANFTTFNMEGFVKKSNKKAADYSDVMAALDALHAPRADAQAWRSTLEAAFDVESFLGVLAFSRAIGHWDSYGVMPHNYYLYGDPSQDGRLVWISWDHNLTWQGSLGFRALSPMMDDIGDNWPLIRYLLDDSVYRAEYTQLLEAALGGAYEKTSFDARATELHTMIAPYVVGDDGEQAPYTFIDAPNQFVNALNEPTSGLIASADALREAVRSTLAR